MKLSTETKNGLFGILYIAGVLICIGTLIHESQEPIFLMDVGDLTGVVTRIIVVITGIPVLLNVFFNSDEESEEEWEEEDLDTYKSNFLEMSRQKFKNREINFKTLDYIFFLMATEEQKNEFYSAPVFDRAGIVEGLSKEERKKRFEENITENNNG